MTSEVAAVIFCLSGRNLGSCKLYLLFDALLGYVLAIPTFDATIGMSWSKIALSLDLRDVMRSIRNRDTSFNWLQDASLSNRRHHDYT